MALLLFVSSGIAIAAPETSHSSTSAASADQKQFSLALREELFGTSSLESSVFQGSLPVAPSNLTATVVSITQINIFWTDNANNETGYKIERKLGAAGTYAQIATVATNSQSYTNYQLTPGSQYFYRVRATNSVGDSAFSNEVTASTPPGTFHLPRIIQGMSGTFAASGLSAPTDPNWQVLDPAKVEVGSGLNPRGWTVTYSPAADTFTVGVPIAAPVGNYYEVKFLQSGSPSYPKSSAFLVVAPSITTVEVLRPSWAEPNIPFDRTNSGGHGPSSADAVDTSTGVMRHAPPADITVQNPTGPNASFQRTYRTSRAAAGFISPGLAVGWFDNYSFTIQSASPSSWSAMTLTHPNGASESFLPGQTAGTANGTFSHVAGSPYILSGSPSATPGVWNSLTLSFKDLSQWKFLPTSTAGQYRLAQIANLVGKFITINRDPTGRLMNITNDSGLTLLSFAYDGSGFLSTVTDISSRQVRYAFSPQSGFPELTQVTQVGASGASILPLRWNYSYSLVFGQPFLSSIGCPDPTNPSQTLMHSFAYDPANGRANYDFDAVGNKHDYTYNSASTNVSLKNTDLTVALSFDQFFVNGLNAGYRDATGRSTSVAYADINDPFQPSYVTNRNGQTTQMTYDSFGNMLTQTDSRGIITTFTYQYPTIAPFGQLYQVKVGTLTATNFNYDALGRIVTVYSPKPGTSTGTQILSEQSSYTNLGNLASRRVLNQAGAQVVYTYNYTTDGTYTVPEAIGQPLTITDPLGRVTHFRYDSLGRMTSVQDASGALTSYYYNNSGQITQVTYPKTVATNPSLPTSVFTYTMEGGDLVKIEDFDEQGMLARTRNAARSKEAALSGATGNTIGTSISLDAINRPVAQIDGNSNKTSLGYDTDGNFTGITYPLGDGQSFTYDNDGNMLQAINGLGQVKNYTLATDDSRLQGITYPASPTENVTFSHDSYSRVTTMTDSTGATDYTYDDLDNITSVTYRYTGLGSKTVSYTYFPDGSRSQMTVGGLTFNYAYNDAGELTSIIAPWSSGAVDFSYKANGLLKKQSDPKTLTALSYDARGGLFSLLNASTVTDINHNVTQAVVSSYSALKRDGLGHLKSYTSSVGRLGNVADTSSNVTLTYDGFEKVSGEKRAFTNNSQNPGYDYGWTRDANGNITLGRLQQFPVNKDNQTNAASYHYNAGGAATAIPAGTFHYDSELRPILIDNVLSNTWRGDGLRGAKSDANGKVVHYIYDLDGLPVAEFLNDDTLYASYLRGPNGLVQRWDNGFKSPTSYTYDPVGNLVMRHQSNSNQFADTVAVYDALGKLYSDLDTNSGGPHAPIDPIGPMAQWGMYTDEQTKGTATGLGMSRSKYYDPLSCRFLSREDRFGNPYVGGDDGSSTIFFFQVMSAIPGIGAPFALAMGVEDIREGDYVSGGLNIAGALLPFATEAVAVGQGLRLAGETAGAISVASGAGESSAMSIVRAINQGEGVQSLIHEAAEAQYLTGLEHGIVSFSDGSRALVRGGTNGITFSESDNLRRVIFHTHPSSSWSRIPGPSPQDFSALKQFKAQWGLKQRSSWVYDRGQLHKFWVPSAN